MTPPALVQLLSQYEQLDNQKEQLLLQRQEQTARNIAQAVSTLVATPMEGRAGYLQMLQQELGLDTGFLNALAQSAPTPTAILLNRGLQTAIESGSTNPSDVAAYALGVSPMQYRINSEVGAYLETGKVPSFIAALPEEVRGQALSQLVTQAGGLPNMFELANFDAVNAVRTQTAPNANTSAQIRSNEKLTAAEMRQRAQENAANRGVQYAQIGEQQRQFNTDFNWRNQQFMVKNATDLSIAQMNNSTRMATSRYLRGSGAGGELTAQEQQAYSIYGQLDNATLAKQIQDLLATNTETQGKAAPGFFGAEDAETNLRTARGISSSLLNNMMTEYRRRMAAGQAMGASQQPPVPQAPRAPTVPQIDTFRVVPPATLGQLLNQQRP